MANQRAQIVMSHDEIVEFLHQQRSSTVATYGPQGQIHLVGMWYAVKDQTVWIETKRKSQKVVNLRRDPRMSFLVETGQTYDQLRGVALEGRGVIIEDPDVVWDVCVDIFNRYNGEYSRRCSRSSSSWPRTASSSASTSTGPGHGTTASWACRPWSWPGAGRLHRVSGVDR